MFVWGASAWSPPLYGLVADVTGSYRVMWLALAAALIVSLIPVLLGREPDQVDMSIMSDI
jgi:cyanate permease